MQEVVEAKESPGAYQARMRSMLPFIASFYLGILGVLRNEGVLSWATAAGSLAAWAGLFGVLYWARSHRLRANRVGLRLDAAGLHDFRTGLHVPWERVKQVGSRASDARQQGMPSPQVLLHVDDTAAVLAALPANARRRQTGFLAKQARKSAAADFVIWVHDLDVPHGELERAAQAWLAHARRGVAPRAV